MFLPQDEFSELRDKANSVNLVDYLNYAGVALVKKGHEWSIPEHDSVSISYEKNIWRQYSQVDPHTGKALSGDAIGFLVRFQHMEFMEAAKKLIEFGYGPNAMRKDVHPPERPYRQLRFDDPKPKGPVQLPEAEKGSWKRLFGYLCQGRCLDKGIVEECIQNKSLYLSAEGHNAVFVTYDEKGVPRYATQRGTLSEKPFKCDCGTESDKSYGWKLGGSPDSQTVYVFESPIDALSFATFEKLKGKDYHRHAKLSLGGVWDGALERFLKANPQIKRICFCTDADGPGKKAANQYSQKYAAKGYQVSRVVPNVGKDINDMLRSVRTQPKAQARPQML